jgi:cytochrome b involved in lipid metabolism
VEEQNTVENDRNNERDCEGNPTFGFEASVQEEPLPASLKPQNEVAPKLSNGKLINIHEPEQAQERSSKARLTTPRMAPPPARLSSPPRLSPPSFSGMLAPPRSGGSALRPSPSAAASLRVPATKVLSNTSMAPTSSTLPQTGKPSRKVILQPGHSPLDWAILTKNPNSKLRGNDLPSQLIRVTPSQLKYHNGRNGKDAWSVYEGKVYNISPYLPFHPGGEGELMRGAGKDAGRLFMEVHPWVNWHNMLAECMVGILVGEGEEKDEKSGGLDEMD